MAFVPLTRLLYSGSKFYSNSRGCMKEFNRNLMSKQLVYSTFGDPLSVVKYREHAVPLLRDQDVLVRMLAAPVNPADMNTIQGGVKHKPKLPSVPGDEGVGEVVEVGSLVSRVAVGNRVILSSRLLGSWRYYGIFNEIDLHVISPNIPLAEASMIAIAPCTAYRMLKDFRHVHHGETVVQNAANSPVGQCVIQLCKAWDINTYNIVATHCGYENVKRHLLSIGATHVCTIEEAEEQCKFDTSMFRPILALNCLGDRYENVMLKLLARNGTIVYYGCAYDLPFTKKKKCHPDVDFCKFLLADWELKCAGYSKKGCVCREKDVMLKEIMQLIVMGKMCAPVYEPLELKNYVHALRNTVRCEAYATFNYVFDLTMP